MSRARAARRPDAGFTLVELMVTIVIASLVTVSTFVFFAGQRRIYDTQMKVLNMQQNLWAAMETVSRYTRVAGVGLTGCVTPYLGCYAGRCTDSLAICAQDTDCSQPQAPDDPPGTSWPPRTGLRAYRDSANPPPSAYGAAGQVIRLAPLWVKNGGGGAPDELTVVFTAGGIGNFADGTLTSGVTAWSSATQISLTNNMQSAFLAGDLALLVDWENPAPGPPAGDRGCTLFHVTNITGSALGHAAGDAGGWNPSSDPGGFIPFTYKAAPNGGVRDLGRLNWIHFYINPSAASAECSAPPCLMMENLAPNPTGAVQSAQVLAEGIEDMQVAYACDIKDVNGNNSPGDGQLTEGPSTTDEWIFNYPGDAPTTAPYSQCNRPRAVRITLVARSAEPDVTLSPNTGKPAAEDRPAGPPDPSPPGPYRRRVMTTVVYPRNR